MNINNERNYLNKIKKLDDINNVVNQFNSENDYLTDIVGGFLGTIFFGFFILTLMINIKVINATNEVSVFLGVITTSVLFFSYLIFKGKKANLKKFNNNLKILKENNKILNNFLK